MHFRYSFRHLSFRILLWPLVCTIICFFLITSLNSIRSDFWRQRCSGWYLNQRIIPTFLTIRTTYFAFVRTKIRARYVVLSFVSVCPWPNAQFKHTKWCQSICNKGFPQDSSEFKVQWFHSSRTGSQHSTCMESSCTSPYGRRGRAFAQGILYIHVAQCACNTCRKWEAKSSHIGDKGC